MLDSESTKQSLELPPGTSAMDPELVAISLYFDHILDAVLGGS